MELLIWGVCLYELVGLFIVALAVAHSRRDRSYLRHAPWWRVVLGVTVAALVTASIWPLYIFRRGR